MGMQHIMWILYDAVTSSQGTEEVHSAPGAPQERSSQLDSHAYMAEVKELQRRWSTVEPPQK